MIPLKNVSVFLPKREIKSFFEGKVFVAKNTQVSKLSYCEDGT